WPGRSSGVTSRWKAKKRTASRNRSPKHQPAVRRLKENASMKCTGLKRALRCASRLNVVWIMVGLLVAWVTPGLAQESPLAQLPADSSVVIQIHGIERTRDRFVALVKSALPDLAPMVQ